MMVRRIQFDKTLLHPASMIHRTKSKDSSDEEQSDLLTGPGMHHFSDQRIGCLTFDGNKDGPNFEEHDR